MTNDSNNTTSRREFLETAAAAAGLMFINPTLVRGTAANSAVRLGVIGCGGRGRADAAGFIENTNTRIAALADLFADQLTTAQRSFDAIQQKKGYPAIATSQLFKGPEAYKQIAASKEVDAILVSSPPYYHPLHLETVVAAGKHVYCEKPVAVDVPGAHRVMRIGENAKGKLSLAVGFQIRKAPPMVELTKRIHAGALGKLGCGLAYYYCAALTRPEWPKASPEEKRLRNWVWDRHLSGDIIVEQNIHVIDMCNWMLQGHPVKAVGIGSRKHRTDSGNCWDNFNVLFTYPGDVQVSFGSSQFDNPQFDAAVRLFGTNGSSESHYDHRVFISGKERWDAGLGPASGSGQFSATGSFQGALDKADSEKQKSFVESITSGQFINEAAQGAESALSAMLGRNAAYSGKPLTWDKLLKSKETFEPKIDISKFA
jgi:myo-inositol 2-dehydrogenase/D-chiro-inositol 1-dehydrogenase